MAVTMFPKKITTQTMGLSARECEVIAESQAPKAIPVLRVWGIVSSKTPGVSQYGPYIKFKGELAAINLVNGEEARSQETVLPQVAETVVLSLFDRAAKDGGSAQIALEVTVEFNPSTKGGTKFRYGVKPLIEFKGDDALAAMAKALPAPKVLETKSLKK